MAPVRAARAAPPGPARRVRPAAARRRRGARRRESGKRKRASRRGRARGPGGALRGAGKAARLAPPIFGRRRHQGPGAHLAAPRARARGRASDPRALRPDRRRQHGRDHRARFGARRAAARAGEDVPRHRARRVRVAERGAAAAQGQRRGQHRDPRLAAGVPRGPAHAGRARAARAVLRRGNAADGAAGGAACAHVQAPQQGPRPERGVAPVGSRHGHVVRADGVPAVCARNPRRRKRVGSRDVVRRGRRCDGDGRRDGRRDGRG